MKASRNNRGRAHENGSIEGPHGHLKRAVEDALLLRGSRDFETIEEYRAFLGQVASRRNARNRARIDAERAVLGPLPGRRSDGFEETLVRVTSTGGFSLRRVFYTVPSRLVGHRLRVRLYDDRLVLYAGTEELMTLPRGHAGPGGRRGRVVNYRHVLPSLRRKPMALLNWVHRDGLFPRDAYRRAFDARREGLDDRQACRRMVDLLALAHDHCCEARLADEIDRGLDAGALPDPELLRKRFPPKPDGIPDVGMARPPVADYDDFGSPALAAGGRRRACSPRWPARRSPTASGGASSGTGPRQSCRRARRSTTSTSPSCPRCQRRAWESWRAATPGSRRAQTCFVSARPERERATWPQVSG